MGSGMVTPFTTTVYSFNDSLNNSLPASYAHSCIESIIAMPPMLACAACICPHCAENHLYVVRLYSISRGGLSAGLSQTPTVGRCASRLDFQPQHGGEVP